MSDETNNVLKVERNEGTVDQIRVEQSDCVRGATFRSDHSANRARPARPYRRLPLLGRVPHRLRYCLRVSSRARRAAMKCDPLET